VLAGIFRLCLALVIEVKDMERRRRVEEEVREGRKWLEMGECRGEQSSECRE
jgi:hypothetical protein